MNERMRQSYVLVLKFKTRQEVEGRLAEVESAISQGLGEVVGNFYFEREALRRHLKGTM